VRTVAIPVWVKYAIDAWMIVGNVEDGRLLRPVLKAARSKGEPDRLVDLVGGRAVGQADRH